MQCLRRNDEQTDSLETVCRLSGALKKENGFVEQTAILYYAAEH